MKAALILLAFWGLIAASATNPLKTDVAPTGKVSAVDPIGERCLSRLDLRIVSSRQTEQLLSYKDANATSGPYKA